MKFPPASTYLSKIANDVALSVVVPNRIAPRLSTLTLRADNVRFRWSCIACPALAVRVHSKSSLHRCRPKAEGPVVWAARCRSGQWRKRRHERRPGAVQGPRWPPVLAGRCLVLCHPLTYWSVGRSIADIAREDAGGSR
jgi:hypothetical protein